MLEKIKDKCQWLYESIIECLSEFNTTLEELENTESIKDVDKFIWKLKQDNLYSKELEKFINDYLRLYND